MSTAITLAPAAAAIITAAIPTPPQPWTATHSPARTPAWTCSAAQAVMKRHPSDAASTSPSASGTRTRFRSARGSATSCANEPHAVKPGWKSRSQIWVSPSRHGSHVPHPQQNGTVTRSPTANPCTDGPASATTPHSSCPGTCGSTIDGSCPIQACQSLRHTPVARTSTTTPSGSQPGSGTSSITSGCSKACITAARIALLSPPWIR